MLFLLFRKIMYRLLISISKRVQGYRGELAVLAGLIKECLKQVYQTVLNLY